MTMLSDTAILQQAKKVLAIEANALRAVQESIDDIFVKVCHCLYACTGKVVLIGLGKSGHIARKIAATLASTGTPAFFIHASEAIHGDLGMLAENDAVIAISHSGETEEVITIMAALQKRDIQRIVITARPRSRLARAGSLVVVLPITEEACPHNLAPTASTTATLAIGDALAVTLFAMRNLTPQDFAKSHPAGSLGKRLLTTVHDLAHAAEKVPMVAPDACVADAVVEMTKKRLGCTLIGKETGPITGIFTDGDLRRSLRSTPDLLSTPISTVMNTQCKRVSKDILASDALAIMKEAKIQVLVVESDDPPYRGIISIYDIIAAGIAPLDTT